MQSSQKAFEDHQEGLGASKDDPDGLDFGLGMDLGGDLGGDNDLDLGMDIFSEGFNIDDDRPDGDGDGDGKRNSMSQPNSPTPGQGGGSGRNGMGQNGPGGPGGQEQSFRYGQEEPGERIEILNQPLAIGYLVSTAGAGRMPRWFWAACPHLERVRPVFLRSALHINQASVLHGGDDGFGPASSSGKVHSLDSSYTTDVLR